MRDDLIPLSAIAFAPPFPNPAPPDAPGEQLQVDLRDLFIDPKYQRPIGPRGEKNIKQVIENFSWSLYSPIVVARRGDGKYAVIDGQHRAIAALTHGGITCVPAYVIRGGPSDEAKAFAVINGAVTAILPTQIWHARVVAGDLSALALQRVFDAAGVTILRSPKAPENVRAGETVAIDAIEKVFKRYGKDPLLLALRTVTKTADGNPNYVRGALIWATVDVLAANPKWLDAPDLVTAAVKTVGIKYLWAKSERSRPGPPKLTAFAAYRAEFESLLNGAMS